MSSPAKQLVFLVSSSYDVGHVNACTGIVSELVRRGHRVIYVLEEVLKGTLAPLGIEEHIFSVKKPKGESKPGELSAKLFKDIGMIGPAPPLVKIAKIKDRFESEEYIDEQTSKNQVLKEAIEQHNPDAILFDARGLPPAIYYSSKPWIKVCSISPIHAVLDDDLPPPGSGLPSIDRSQWAEYREIAKEFFYSKSYNDLIEKMGYPRYPDDYRSPPSQILTVCAIPDEMLYPEIRKLGWFNLEAFNKPKSEVVPLSKLVPSEFLANDLNGKYSGKLIYFSFGSIVSYDVDLMRRLVGTLAQTNHKYIVSKGHRHAEYDLPPNMWGDRFLSQMQFLPHVDLVITHAGNNTFTESFAHGLPMVAMPVCGDMYCNAQRLHEVGLGVRVEPYHYTDHELISAIDRLLYDTEVARRMKQASHRIRSSNKHQELAIHIETLLG